MSAFEDAVQVLGVDRVAEIRAGVEALLRQVLADHARYARKRPLSDKDARRRGA